MDNGQTQAIASIAVATIAVASEANEVAWVSLALPDSMAVCRVA